MIYGKLTFSGRQPGKGPQLVLILHPFLSFTNVFFLFSIKSASVNQNKITVASSKLESKIFSHRKLPPERFFLFIRFCASLIYFLSLSIPIAILTPNSSRAKAIPIPLPHPR